MGVAGSKLDFQKGSQPVADSSTSPVLTLKTVSYDHDEVVQSIATFLRDSVAHKYDELAEGTYFNSQIFQSKGATVIEINLKEEGSSATVGVSIAPSGKFYFRSTCLRSVQAPDPIEVDSFKSLLQSSWLRWSTRNMPSNDLKKLKQEFDLNDQAATEEKIQKIISLMMRDNENVFSTARDHGLNFRFAEAYRKMFPPKNPQSVVVLFGGINIGLGRSPR